MDIVLWESWARNYQDGQLEDIELPSNSLEGEIIESNPHLWVHTQLAHIECSCVSRILQLIRTLELVF